RATSRLVLRRASSAFRSRSSSENKGAPRCTRSPALTYTATTRPETGVLTAMFSELGSTSPIAATELAKATSAGAAGGGDASRRQRQSKALALAKASAASAITGMSHLFINSVAPFLRRDAGDPAIIHACDEVCELKYAAVMCHNDDSAIRPHSQRSEKLHHLMAG